MGVLSIVYWWRRRQNVAGFDELYGPVLWSGGLWRATVRIGLTAAGWACLPLAAATGDWLWAVLAFNGLWLAVAIGARVPVTDGFQRRTAARSGGAPPE